MDHWNAVGWSLILNYKRTLSTYYYLESSGQAAYMEIHHVEYKGTFHCKNEQDIHTNLKRCEGSDYRRWILSIILH